MALTTIVAAAAMTVGGMAFLGCESSNPSGSQSTDDRSGFAGGNGEFGESPAQAGEYAQPSTQPPVGYAYDATGPGRQPRRASAVDPPSGVWPWASAVTTSVFLSTTRSAIALARAGSVSYTFSRVVTSEPRGGLRVQLPWAVLDDGNHACGRGGHPGSRSAMAGAGFGRRRRRSYALADGPSGTPGFLPCFSRRCSSADGTAGAGRACWPRCFSGVATAYLCSSLKRPPTRPSAI